MTTISKPKEVPFVPSWPEPDKRFLMSEVPKAPDLPLATVFGPRLQSFVMEAAEGAGAPVDYVFAGNVTAAGALIGNTRWASPWGSWKEPPIVWSMCIGLPSAGKSPAITAALAPLFKIEKRLRAQADEEKREWDEQAQVAKLAEDAWKESVKQALKDGKPSPPRPCECDVGDAPHLPRLVVHDATIERLGVILAGQPRGLLLARDELAGWLQGMTRYSGGGSDRPFWLEAYGGRPFTVERMSRPPLTIDHLSVGVTGGIQPDKLKSLLFRADDDGLLSRFLPIWPEPAPIRRPRPQTDEGLWEAILMRLHSLEMTVDQDGNSTPRIIPLSEPSRLLMDKFRERVREWELESEGLLQSFIGKLPGLAVRLALIIALLEWAEGNTAEPQEIRHGPFLAATLLIDTYLLPMARRAYAGASLSREDRLASRVVGIIREEGWREFSSRDLLRLGRSDLDRAEKLDPVLVELEKACVIRAIEPEANAAGGRPPKRFIVNPAVHGGSE